MPSFAPFPVIRRVRSLPIPSTPASKTPSLRRSHHASPQPRMSGNSWQKDSLSARSKPQERPKQRAGEANVSPFRRKTLLRRHPLQSVKMSGQFWIGCLWFLREMRSSQHRKRIVSTHPHSLAAVLTSSVKYSPLLLSQLPQPRGGETSRWEVDPPLDVIFHCRQQRSEKEKLMGSRLLTLVSLISDCVRKKFDLL